MPSDKTNKSGVIFIPEYSLGGENVDALDKKKDSPLGRYVFKFFLFAFFALLAFMLLAFLELQDDFWDLRAKECQRDVISLQSDIPVYDFLTVFDSAPPKIIKRSSLMTLWRLGIAYVLLLLVSFRWIRRTYKLDLESHEFDEVMSIFETRTTIPGEGKGKINGFEALNRLGEYLHRYHNDDEVHQVIRKMAMVLFPLKNGAFYTYSDKSNALDLAVSWGQFVGPRSMAPQECVGVVSTRMNYLRRGEEAKERCSHLPPKNGEYLCIPIMGMGRLFGLFHLQAIGEESQIGSAVPDWISVARAFADRVGLYLANLRLQADYEAQALRDPVTRVFNGRYLEETLVREIFAARRRNMPVGLLLIDLDHYTDIGSVFGNSAVETFLAEVARLITQSVREEDVCCRFKDGEFGVLLPGASMSISLDRAEGIRRAVEQLHLAFGEHFLSTTVTVAVGLFPDHAQGPEDLLSRTRTSLKLGCQQGRNRTVIVGT